MSVALALTLAAEDARRIEAALVVMAVAAAATHCGVRPEDVYTFAPKTRKDFGLRLNRARDMAVALLHTAAGMTQKNAGAWFAMTEDSTRQAVKRSGDLRDEDPDVESLFADCEAAIARLTG